MYYVRRPPDRPVASCPTDPIPKLRYAIPSMNEGSRDLAWRGRRKWMLNQNRVNRSKECERRNRKTSAAPPSSKGSDHGAAEQQHHWPRYSGRKNAIFSRWDFPLSLPPSLHLALSRASSLLLSPSAAASRSPHSDARPLTRSNMYVRTYDALVSRFLPTSSYLSISSS